MYILQVSLRPQTIRHEEMHHGRHVLRNNVKVVAILGRGTGIRSQTARVPQYSQYTKKRTVVALIR